MNNIILNAVIEWLDTTVEKTLVERVLWLSRNGETLYVICINDSKALPVLRTRDEVEDALRSGKSTLRTVDPYARLASLNADTNQKHLEIRDSRWEMIKGLISNEPEIYDKKCRKKLINADPVASAKALDYVYGNLRNYWQRGKVKNALIPDYANCGAPGKERGVKEGKKRGRPSRLAIIDPEFSGVNIDESTKAIFAFAVGRYYETKEKYPLKKAYNKMIENHFNQGYANQGDVLVPIMPDAHQIPTFGQFRHWYIKNRDLAHSIKSRVGQRSFALNHRPLLGDSTQMAFGPGSIYQIDATIADLYLVCSYDRTRIIGRPVVYFCMDCFSRMCVGLYVGLEGPSWLTGMMALENATTDKVEFCARYGITITTVMWPCKYLPEQILADRGEFISISSDHLVNNLNITFANCPPYRGDLKAIVERAFRRANDTFIHWVPGAVRKSEYGSPDRRRDAIFTLEEFTKALLLMILQYNLHHRLDNYRLDRDVMSDGVEPIPIDLWHWGIVNRTGHLRQKSQDAIRLALLPMDIATITPRGIRFKGVFYSCERAIKEQWFVRARHSGSSKVDASFDLRRPEVIYLHLGNGLLEPCQLLPCDERFRDMRFEEIMEFHEVEKQKSAHHCSREIQTRAELNANFEEQEKKSRESTDAAWDKAKRNRSKIKDIKANRLEENNRLREEQAWDMRPPKSRQQGEAATMAEIVPLSRGEKENPTPATLNRSKLLDLIKQADQEDEPL